MIETVQTIDITPDAKGLIDWAMSARAGLLDEQGTTVATRLYFLCGALPDAQAGELLAVARGELEIVVEGSCVRFEQKES